MPQPAISRSPHGLGIVEELHRVHHVQQHPLGEEGADHLRRLTRDALASSTRSARRAARPRAHPDRHSRRSTAASAAAAHGSRSAALYASPIACSASLPLLAARGSLEDLIGLLHRCGGSSRGRAPSSSRRGGRGRAGRCRLPWRSCRSRRRGGPCGENSRAAASRTASRRSSAVCLTVVVLIGSEYLLPTLACQANRRIPAATRSRSSSVRREWSGSASARSNARVGARERPLVAIRTTAGAARTSRSAPRSPPHAASRVPRPADPSGSRTPASRACRPRRRPERRPHRRAAVSSRRRCAHTRRATRRAGGAGESRSHRGCRRGGSSRRGLDDVGAGIEPWLRSRRIAAARSALPASSPRRLRLW